MENSSSFQLLGVRVDAVSISEVIARMEQWISIRRRGHFIAATGMHGIMEARHDLAFRRLLNSADLVVPDGMPLVWFGRMGGQALKRRVYGPELMEAFCGLTGEGYRHFFYGGAPGVPEALADLFHKRYGIRIAGADSPPYRALTCSEHDAITRQIRSSAPDVLWVGLGTPKQERWMSEHVDKLGVPVLVGVGAAFDFHTGRVKQAPIWMRESGLEWLFRLGQEPARLWRRYLIFGTEFVWLAGLELLGLKKY